MTVFVVKKRAIHYQSIDSTTAQTYLFYTCNREIFKLFIIQWGNYFIGLLSSLFFIEVVSE